MRRPISIATATLVAASALLASRFATISAAQANPPAPSAQAGAAFTAKVPVIATIRMPAGYTSEGWPPLWFEGGELAVIGRQSGRIIVLGYNGADFQQQRILAPDPDYHNSVILDLAENGTQTMLAAAIGNLEDGHIDVTLRDVSEDQPTRQLAHMEGRFSAAGLSWIDSTTLALELVSQPSSPQATPTSTPEASPTPTPAPPAAAGGIYALSLNPGSTPRKINLHCAQPINFTRTVWSPNGRYAIADSDPLRPILIDRVSLQCETFKIPAGQRFHLIGWNQDSNRFLYAIAPDNYVNGLPGFFEYDLDAGQSRVIAAPAAAATYLRGGRIAALGNRNLNARLIAKTPDAILPAEIALIDPSQSQIVIAPLGFNLPAAALLKGAIAYSRIADELAIQLFFPNPNGDIPVLVSFFPATQKALAIAAAKAGSTLSVSWSPRGNLLAVLDASAAPPILTVLSLPVPGAQSGSGSLRSQ
ncbi:MAG: hypothetical protein ABSD31_01855 [Candidatus Binataceae bacterium]